MQSISQYCGSSSLQSIQNSAPSLHPYYVTLGPATVTPCLDSCSGLLIGVPASVLTSVQSVLASVQSVLNPEAGEVLWKFKLAHTTLLLQILQCIPVSFREAANVVTLTGR